MASLRLDILAPLIISCNSQYHCIQYITIHSLLNRIQKIDFHLLLLAKYPPQLSTILELADIVETKKFNLYNLAPYQKELKHQIDM